MKKCISCQAEIKESAKFCTVCGAPQEEVIEKKEIIEKDNYFKYLLENIKNPQIINNKSNNLFGLINYGLITFFIMATFLLLANNMGSYFGDDIFTGIVLKLVVTIALLLLGYNIILFAINRLIIKNQDSFYSTFSDIYSVSSIAVVLAVMLFLFTLLSILNQKVFLTLYILIFCVVNTSFLGNVWIKTKINKINLNQFYVVFISTIVIFLYSLLVVYLFSKDLLNMSGMY